MGTDAPGQCQGSTHPGPCSSEGHPKPPCSRSKASAGRISPWKRKQRQAWVGVSLQAGPLLGAPGEGEGDNAGGQRCSPHCHGGVHPGQSRFLPRARSQPKAAGRCLCLPFSKRKNNILGELCGFPAWGTRAEPGAHPNPPPLES